MSGNSRFTTWKWEVSFVLIATLSFLTGCRGDRLPDAKSISEMAANEDVARYLESFKGLGALTDSSQATPPDKALENFHVPEDLPSISYCRSRRSPSLLS